MPSAVFANDLWNIVFAVSGSSTAFKTVREQLLPGVLLESLAKGCLGEFIHGLALGFRLRSQFGQ